MLFITTMLSCKKKRGRKMELKEFLRLRDRVIKNGLLRDLPLNNCGNARKMIAKAFRSGSKRFKKVHLPNLIGQRRASRLDIIV